MDINPTDYKALGLTGVIVLSLIGVLVWAVKVALPQLLTTYREDMMRAQVNLEKMLDSANKNLESTQQRYLLDLDTKRREYMEQLVIQRQQFFTELGTRDKVLEKLTNVVEKLVDKVDKVADIIDRDYNRSFHTK